MSKYRFGRTAHYIRREACSIRQRWTGDYCLHVEYNSVRHDKYKSYVKTTEKCMLTKPESIVGIKITTIEPNQRRGLKYYIENGAYLEYGVAE